ncbi:hypothetical protein [Nostoc sp.]|uniref:hypothetical protein n=1 Tax=Nostoc sp. TaxID=1180 RepID=UPI002FFB8254
MAQPAVGIAPYKLVTEILGQFSEMSSRNQLAIAQIFWTTRKIHLGTPVNFTPFSGVITIPSELYFIFVKKISIIPVVTTGVLNKDWLYSVLRELQQKNYPIF